MNPFGLPENKYGNISCYDPKTRSVDFPDGYVMTHLSVTQLKKIGVETAKAHCGFDLVRFGGTRRHVPILVNLIRKEDEPKAVQQQHKLTISKNYGMKDVNWLFE